MDVFFLSGKADSHHPEQVGAKGSLRRRHHDKVGAPRDADQDDRCRRDEMQSVPSRGRQADQILGQLPRPQLRCTVGQVVEVVGRAHTDHGIAPLDEAFKRLQVLATPAAIAGHIQHQRAPIAARNWPGQPKGEPLALHRGHGARGRHRRRGDPDKRRAARHPAGQGRRSRDADDHTDTDHAGAPYRHGLTQ